MPKAYFKETQRYKNKFVPFVLGLVVLITLIRGLSFLLTPEPKIGPSIFLFVVAVSIGAVIWWLTKLKLKVSISERSVKFKLFPLHTKKHTIAWDEIERCEIVKTSEAAQWSGGNITFNHEKRYSLTGRNGLAIKTKNGDYYFIGCRNISGLEQALDRIKVTLSR